MSYPTTKLLTLDEFLKLPETKPASEYINGEIIPKPMPKGKHSRLQLRLCNTINEVAESQKIAYAFPELRCSFDIRSIVPDVAVFNWSRIPFDVDGEVPNDFCCGQIGQLKYSLRTEFKPSNWQHSLLLTTWLTIRWLIDPTDRSILVFRSGNNQYYSREKIFCLYYQKLNLHEPSIKFLDG